MKNVTILLRLTVDQKELIQAAASRKGKTVSGFVLACALGRSKPPKPKPRYRRPVEDDLPNTVKAIRAFEHIGFSEGWIPIRCVSSLLKDQLGMPRSRVHAALFLGASRRELELHPYSKVKPPSAELPHDEAGVLMAFVRITQKVQ
jgi:hypothetical protein